MPCHRKKYFPFGRTPSVPIYSDRKGAVVPQRSPFPRWIRAPCIMRVVARPERAVFSAPPPVAAEVAQASLENCLNSYYPPICVRLMYRRPHACPQPAPACIVLPRAAPQPMRAREPREPDTAEDAGGQTDHLGQAYKGGLRKDTSFHKPPSFMSSLNPFISTLKSLFGRRVRSWLRTNAGGAPNTCKSRG